MFKYWILTRFKLNPSASAQYQRRLKWNLKNCFVSCINHVRRFSWLSNFQLNNLHNVCVSPEQSEDFAKYFSATIIINSAMINFSLSCEMVLVNINIYTQSVSNLSVHGRGCYSNFDLPSVSSPVRTFVLLPTTRPHDCWMLPETGLHRMPIY